MSRDERNETMVTKRLLEALAGALGQHLPPEARRVGVAVSGGVDSMVLLEAVHHLARTSDGGLDVTVLHVDHGLRADSEADARFVAARTLAMGHAFAGTRLDLAAGSGGRGGNLQETARAARYGWFAEKAEALGLEAILTAHHADDQIETVALALLRGADTLALGGIPAARPLTPSGRTLLVRPWHTARRADIEEAARVWEVPRREDASNDTLRYRRNLVRHVLMPAAERDDDLGARLIHLGDRAATAERRIDTLARRLEGTLPVHSIDDANGRRIVLPRREVAALPAAVATRLIERAAARCRPDRPHLGSRTARRILDAREGETFELTRGLHVDVTPDTFVVRHTIDHDLPDVTPLLLQPGTSVDIPWDGRRVRATLCADGSPGHSPFEQWLPSRSVRGALTIRGPRRGERVKPFGMGGTKLVADILAEAGVPATVRWRTPVIADDDGILWIPGVRAAERCRVTRSEELLRLAITDA